MDGAKPPSQASASASLAILNTVSRLASGRGRLRDSSRPPAVAPRGVRPRSVGGGRLHDAPVQPTLCPLRRPPRPSWRPAATAVPRPVSLHDVDGPAPSLELASRGLHSRKGPRRRLVSPLHL